MARSEPDSFGLNPDYFGERDLAGALLVAAVILFVTLRCPDTSGIARVRSDEGEPPLIRRENGHLLARGANVRNVSLVGDPLHIVYPGQLDDLFEELRDAGGHAVFVGDGAQIPIHPGLRAGLRARGLRPTARDRGTGLVMWRPRE